jgi:hypothetical protein
MADSYTDDYYQWLQEQYTALGGTGDVNKLSTSDLADFVFSSGLPVGGLAPGTRLTSYLPHNMATASVLAACVKKVYAHFFPPTPVSVNNLALNDASEYYYNHWLPPGDLEGGTQWDNYGGYVRDLMSRNRGKSYTIKTAGSFTPVFGGSVTNAQRLNSKEQIVDAIDAGLDGFFCDYLSLSGNNHDWTLGLYEALILLGSAGDNFKIGMMVDASGTASAVVNTIADRIKDMIVAYGNYMPKNPSNNNVIIPVYRPEGRGAAHWTSVKSRLSATWGITIDYWFCYEQPWTTANQAPAHNADAAVHGRWGDPDYTTAGAANNDNRNAASYCTSTYGKPWLAPVRIQDTRPKPAGGLTYWEAKNLTLLRTGWDVAINNGAGHVQITTWSDLSEHSHIAPSMNQGFCALDLTAYYAQWFKTGVQPPIVRDVLYLSHRIHNTALASFTGTQSVFQTKAGTSSAENLVEVMAFLKEAADIKLTINHVDYTFSGVAGINVFTAPLAYGDICASAIRDEKVVAFVATGQKPSATQMSQDLQYRIFSSAGR